MLRKKHTTPIQELITELRVMGEYIKTGIASAAELRTSFVIQIVGMMVNNVAFLAAWWLFLGVFGNINGWSGVDVIALEGITALIFGIGFTFFPGIGELPSVVNNGAFDSFLLTPRNIYLRVLTMTMRPSAIGDIFYGLIAIGIYLMMAHLSAQQIILFLVMLVPAAVIFINFSLVAACVSFFIPDSIETAKNVFEIMFGPSLYPAGVFQGVLRFCFLYIVPSLAIAGLPVEAVKGLDMAKALIVWLLAIVWTLIAQYALRQGIRHYESGNLTGARV